MFGIDLSLVLAFVTGLLAGAVAALKVIAPKTKNTIDDKVLEVVEKAEQYLPKQ
jgi:hypothetical protein